MSSFFGGIGVNVILISLTSFFALIRYSNVFLFLAGSCINVRFAFRRFSH
jgi:hypothetical protein